VRLLLDLKPMRHRDFRFLWIGLFVTRLGTGITFVAVPYQVFKLTRSVMIVGLLGVVEIVPLVFSALLGGAFADAVDRRKLVRYSEIGLLVCSAGLAVNASISKPHVWPIFVMVALASVLDGFQRPALEAMFPRLVPHDELPAVSALNSFRGSVAFLAGPLIAGFLITWFGVRGAYLGDVGTFVVSLILLIQVRAVPPPDDAERPSIESIKTGLRYARSRPELIGTYLIDIVAMFFGMPLALLPGFSERFGDARAFGVLNAAPFVGAMLVNLTSRWTTNVHRHGRAIVLAASVWGLGIVGLGFSNQLWIAFVCFAIAGGADMISGLFRMTMWNQTIPDSVRGRLAGIEMISYSTGPLLGNVESGAAAAWLGIRGAIISGGALCTGGSALLATALPEFWAYDARTHPAAVQERLNRSEREQTAAALAP
jgi:MFS family permease